MSGAALLWLGVCIPVFLGAASLSRLHVADGRAVTLLAALALYCFGNLLMIRLMRESGLGLAISASSIAQLVLVNLVAFLVFGERLSSLQLCGLVLGGTGLVLMMWPAGAP